MNELLIKEVAVSLKITNTQVTNVLLMLQEGNTVPFIARYRKEKTGGLDEEVIHEIDKVYQYSVNLLERKEQVIRLIEEKGMMNDQLKQQILNCSKLVEIEDLYLPFKEKKNTLAMVAKNQGLEPLAIAICNFEKLNIDEEVVKYFNDVLTTKEDVLTGVMHIIAENISDSAIYRKYIRNVYANTGLIVCKKKKNAVDENETYKMYYEYSELVKKIKPHNVLAINRSEKSKVITVKVEVDDEAILNYLAKQVIKLEVDYKSIFIDAIKDSYKRLIAPSIEREIRRELSDKSEDSAIEVFSQNLSQLLLQAPFRNIKVLGLDPAYRTGCKLAVVSDTGALVKIDKIYLHHDEKSKLLKLIQDYNIDVVAIGNGTASRESEQLVSSIIKENNLNISYVIVNEAGASVYSASALAREEFPDLAVEERSAVSIARRLQDPLAELVKIDTKSIGIGQYQHDVNQKKLNDELDFVVSKIVNLVGVDVNSASVAILEHISGLSKKIAKNIVEFRNEVGHITSRKQILKVAGVGKKNYEQAIGFLRVNEGDNPLDKTSIHPESYDVANTILKTAKINSELIGTTAFVDALNELDLASIATQLEVDQYTFNDIVDALKQPLRDPRDSAPAPILRQDVLTIEDLEIGMKLKGTVRNIVDFGAFVDIGVKNDGLVHISKLSKKFIKHPLDVVSIGDIVEVTIIDVDKQRYKVALSMVEE